jgi:uncharacterized protein YigE (DUF2233 family)
VTDAQSRTIAFLLVAAASLTPGHSSVAVGIQDPHTVVFAISEGEVSFAAFARLFRDGLKCSNALFLDGGSAPSLYAPSLRRGGNLLSLGPMLGVFRNAGADPN